MRDPNRIEPMLALIRKIWYTNPDLRLTQLLMNALGINQDPYYVEDQHMYDALEDYIHNYITVKDGGKTLDNKSDFQDSK